VDVAFYKNLRLSYPPQVYEPREDSFLLADQISVADGQLVLDIGTGTGIQAIVAAQQGALVIAVDINPHAIDVAQENATENNVGDLIEFRKGYLFEPIKKTEQFDLIIFNPPYLPKDPEQESEISQKLDWIDYSYSDSAVITEFVKQYKKHLKPGGRALIVNSSISGIKVYGKILAEQKLDFETISVVELHLKE